MNPLDAETIDLERWGTQGGLLSTGFDHPSTVGFGNSSNFFRPDDQIKRVISPSVPVGKAIIADWNTMILFVRESMSLMMNYWADSVFTTNAYLLRAEMRCVVGFVRPQAFALATITGA